MEDVTATLYAIKSCGYFREQEFQFGNVGEVFDDFSTWVNSLASIGESSTYLPNEDDTFLRSFCMDARELNISGVFVIATWNEMATVEDGIQILSVGSRIGHAHVSNVNIDALSLPGYPAYYCIDTRNGLAINLRFEQRLNGSRQFQKFIWGFLQGYSSWCVWADDGLGELLGYSADGSAEYDESVEPDFSTCFVRVAGKIDYIRQNVASIRKVVRRANLSPQVEEEKSFIDKSFEILGLAKNNRLRSPIPYQYELKMRLTREKFEGVVDEFERGDANDSWNDTGFMLARQSQKIYWLSGSIARQKLGIDVIREAEGNLIDMDSLAEYLDENLDQLVEALRGAA